jgi:Rod binding domain-containing protein
MNISNPFNMQFFDPKSQINASSGVLRNEPVDGKKNIKDACVELESLFINQLLKEMRATVQKSGLIDGGQGEEIFTSIMDAELSKTIASSKTLGIADRLAEQLSGKTDNSGQEKRQYLKTIKGYTETADI